MLTLLGFMHMHRAIRQVNNILTNGSDKVLFLSRVGKATILDLVSKMVLV